MKLVAHLAVLLLATSPSFAQKPSDTHKRNEIGLNIGTAFTPAVPLRNGTEAQFNPALTLGAEYDFRIVERRTFAVAPGVDFFASPLDEKLSHPPPSITPEYAFLFLTPNVRLTLHPDGAIRPWVLFGGGYANFASAVPPAPRVEVRGHGSGGAFEFGGGIDTKTLLTLPGLPVLGALPVGARFEVRDFYSTGPEYGLPTGGGLQTTLAFTGGLLLRF